MKILAHLHKYPPEHGAGAEWYAHELLLHLKRRGHDVDVIARDISRPYELDGLSVDVGLRKGPTELAYARADAVITHLDVTRQCVMLARKHQIPVVHLVHNDAQLKYHRVHPRDAAIVVCNSEWIRRAVKWRGKTVVVRPYTPTARYSAARVGELADATLVNLSAEKGARVLDFMAKAMPDRRFLAVEGAYGPQEDTDHENIERLANTGDMAAVYARTRVLLAPSAYESWGRCAVEAACSGIPTIAHPTPGLLESLGPAGLFVSRERPSDWCEALEMLDDPTAYATMSRNALRKARLHETAALAELDALADEMEAL